MMALGRVALAALLATPVVLAGPAIAAASPFGDPTRGGAVFTGPTHADPSSITINPAALGLFAPGYHIYVIGSGRADRVRIARKHLDLDSGALTPGPEVDAGTEGLGWQVAGAFNFQRVFLSLAVDMPAADRYPGDDALGYHSLGGRWQRRTLFAGAFSWRVVAPLWIGVGLNISRQELDLDFSRDSALEAGRAGLASDCDAGPCGAENPAAAETYQVRVHTPWFSTSGLGLSVGLVTELAGWYLAASYEGPWSRSAVRADGDVTMTAAPRDGAAEHTGFAEVEYYLPQVVRLAGRGLIAPGLDLLASARWSNTSRHAAYDLRMFGSDLPAEVPAWYRRYRGFHDEYALEGGVEQRDGGERLRLGARASIESGAVGGAEATALQIEGPRLGLAVGAQLRLGQRLVVQLGYQLGWYPTLSADPGVFDPVGRLDCVDAAYDLDACGAVRDGRGLPSAAGDYDRLSHAVRLAIRLESL